MDSKSQLPGGREIADVRAYKKALAAQPEILARCFVRKVATFATGVGVELQDEFLVDKVLEATKPSGYGLRTILHEVIQNELFTRK